MGRVTAAAGPGHGGLHLAAASGGFAAALAGVGPLFLSFLAVHVAAGLTAVITGALAATAPKRRGRHTRSGAVYYWAITVVFATATAMTALRPARDYSCAKHSSRIPALKLPTPRRVTTAPGLPDRPCGYLAFSRHPARYDT